MRTKRREVLRLILIAGAQGEAQEAFLFAPEHGEDTVGRGLRGGFVPREIVAVLGGVGNLFLAGNGFAPHESFAPEEFTQAFAGGLILGEALRKDVTRSGKRRFRIRHALFGVYIGGGHRFGEGAILTGQLIGQRFEAALLRH